jgi:hypothetical protein
MTDTEKLKSTLSAIFKRKGGNGRYTRLFENLEPSQKDALVNELPLRGGELPVIGSVESRDKWLLITTERIVWRLEGETHTLAVRDIQHVAADLRKLVATGRRKEHMRELQLKTMSDELLTVEVEEGAPLMGVWNALLNLCARNRRAAKASP